ncbi:MAG: response regulator transcription factor [Ruminococcaceae bacterium]|nr:response regulator transcription factor [Oscillospiraceae bacterium]
MIYMVEDEANIRELVVYTLNASSFTARGFAGAAAFYAALKTERPALVLLDIMLPGENGLDILRRLRRQKDTRTLPVIMLTAKDTEYDKVIGLDAGADDYLTKPFGMMELVSRVKSLLRRVENYGGEAPPQQALVAGPIRLTPQKHTVEVNGVPLALTLKEYDLLLMLMERPGIVLNRDVLLEQIWGYTYEGETRTVDVHIRSLRQKLGPAANAIETVRGVGYRFTEDKP